VEDASLLELADFIMEVLGRTALPVGTLFLVGSISHLVQVGSTLYCLEWQKMVSKLADRWPNSKVGPIPPILRDDSSGNTGRCIVEIKHWFTSVYTGSGSLVFFSSAWDAVLKGLTHTVYQLHDLDHAETYTVATIFSWASCTHSPVSSAVKLTPRNTASQGNQLSVRS